MKVAITGSSKLSHALRETLSWDVFTTFRVDEKIDKDFYDVFINHAHVGIKQMHLLGEWAEHWQYDSNKTIINISSRAAFPNLSKGYKYAAEKAALNHLSDNLTFNSEVECRITTLNLGLLENNLPSLKYVEVARVIKMILDMPSYMEVPSMTLQHRYPYKKVQRLKECH